MSSFRMEGFDDLVRKLDTMGQVGNKIGNNALKAASQVIVEQQKKDAPRDTGKGAESLKPGKIKTSAAKNKYIQVGIVSESNWESVQGVYFQHYGYKNHRTGKYHAGSLWMDHSFEKAKGVAAKLMLTIINKELKL